MPQQQVQTYQIRQTDEVTLEGRTFEVEIKTHKPRSLNDSYKRPQMYQGAKLDCPEGWDMPSYWLIQQMRNNPELSEKFGLGRTEEFVQNPDYGSRLAGKVAIFSSHNENVSLRMNEDADYASAFVRYVRETNPSSV